MRCTILASGSKGNCTFIEGSDAAILVDAGLSAKEALARMARAGLDSSRIDAILVTHEHGDHVRGLDVLARKLDVPIYGTSGTLGDFLGHRRTSSKPIESRICTCGERFNIGNLSILPYATSHDAAEPCGYIVREDGLSLGYCTDTGIVTPAMMALLRQCDGLVLESNHCPEMLATGPYPESLKRRIRSKRGHLSNAAAAGILREFGKDTPPVILAHLSEINNTPERAMASARDGLGLFFAQACVSVATQAGPADNRDQSLSL